MIGNARTALAILVAVAALTLAFVAGVSVASRDRTCISAPLGNTIATWCGRDVPQPSTF